MASNTCVMEAQPSLVPTLMSTVCTSEEAPVPMPAQNAGMSCVELLDRLNNQFLPELKSSYDECIWLWTQLGLDSRQDLQNGESRLLQFANALNILIRQIESFDYATIDSSDTPLLQLLEQKISLSILPIQSKLSAKLQEARREKLESDRLGAAATIPVPVLGNDADASMCIVPPVCLSNTPYVDPLAVMPASLLPLANMTPAYISPIPVTFMPAIPNPEVTAPVEKKKRKRYPKKAASNLSIDATFSDKKQRAQRSPTAVHENMSVKQESLTFLNDDNLDNNMDYSLFDPSSDLYCYDAQFPSDMDSLCFDIIPEEHVIAAFPSNTMHQDSSSVSMRICTEEYISPKRRRRLNQIVPNPRKPWTVEYQCSLCSENYSMGVQENPWYTVCIHECPHCKMKQVPKFDINAPCNTIELDPNIIALYGEGVDDEDCVGEEDEVEDGNGEDQEEEDHPFGAEGSLEFEEASKLLVLMCHARTCTGVHTSAKHSEICKSTKFLMLHIRDCNGIDIYGNDCKFPWCTPCKRMLKHLTRCYEPTKCSICNPFTLPESYRQLQTINNLRVTS